MKGSCIDDLFQFNLSAMSLLIMFPIDSISLGSMIMILLLIIVSVIDTRNGRGAFLCDSALI